MLQQGLDMGWLYPVALGRILGQIFLCYSSIFTFGTLILLLLELLPAGAIPTNVREEAASIQNTFYRGCVQSLG